MELKQVNDSDINNESLSMPQNNNDKVIESNLESTNTV